MKYDVCVGYNHFIFNNSEEAIAFAEQAKVHYFSRRDDDEDLDVEIKIINNNKEED